MNNLLSIFQEWTAAERGSRSTALKSLVTMIGGVLLAVLMASSSWFDSPVWLLIVLLILLGALVLAYLLAFRYLLLNDPDALRSESFILKRTALEHRLEGDSIYGVIQSSDGADRLLLTKAEKDVEA